MFDIELILLFYAHIAFRLYTPGLLLRFWISSWACQSAAPGASTFSSDSPLFFCNNFTAIKQLNPAAYEHPANAINPQYCPSQILMISPAIGTPVKALRELCVSYIFR